eukprot:TRINITY_DN15680_c0_g1_i1.p1 TRINITY_DN15680_c0_g1~~TRINITY_DN15680_c0_g1_i1.p1  ORF type:complete len:462 (+),score=98.80 TRINITY_DN15680_c0_g1_i1:24-1388(+)
MAIQSDAIYVTVNYRLGVLGFLGGAEVAKTSGDGSAGNFGLQDTREALRWVRRNIAALGGDPSKITIAGESSGASMVATHMVAPRSFGLFAAAIMQSGPFDNYTAQVDPDSAFQDFYSYTKCSYEDTDAEALECLRAMPESDLNYAIRKSAEDGWFSPAIDGVELTDTPEVLASKGQLAEVEAVMIGTNVNEGRFMMLYDNEAPGAPWTNESQFRQWLHNNSWSPEIIEKVVQLYPPSNFEEPARFWKAATKVYTDLEYFCPTRRSAAWLLNSKRVKNDRVFIYELVYEPSYEAQTGRKNFWWAWCRHSVWKWTHCDKEMSIRFGAAHGAEVPLVWGKSAQFNATDAQLAKQVIGWWQQFARSFNLEDPQDNGIDWPRTGKDNFTMLLKPQPEVIKGARQRICDLWEHVHPVPYNRPHQKKEARDDLQQQQQQLQQQQQQHQQQQQQAATPVVI